MSDEADDYGAKLGHWLTVVRRARLSDPKKRCFALTVGSYADNDGTSVKAGIARLSTDCEMGYSTARRYLAWMREAGLIELARTGNGKKGTRSDEYRLTVQPHTEKALGALGVTEYNDLIDGKRKANSAAEKERRLRAETSTALTQEVSAVPRESEEATALAQGMSAVEVYCAHPMSELPPIEKRSPPTGGAPPPDPRRPEPPTASGSRLGAQQEISAAHHPAQDLQRNSRPHASATHAGEQLATVHAIDSFRRPA